MPEVVEIVQRLGFELVGTESLQNAIDKLKRQAEAIERQKKSLAELREYQKKIGDESPQLQKQAQTAIDNTTKSIDRQTESLKRNFEGNVKLQAALNEELGAMQQLSQFIARHAKEREALTDPAQIKQYTEEIKAAQAELKALVTPIQPIRKVGEIEGLKNRQTLLQNAISSAPNNPAYIADLNKELDKTKAKIKDLQNAGREPIVNIRQVGAIEAVEQKIKILSNTLKTVPRENIAAINEQLKIAKRELADLEGVAGSGILSKLFSRGTQTGQILRGVLGGLGIGVGYQIVTTLISHLVDLAKYEFDVTQKSIDLQNANDGLLKSFEDLGEATKKIAQEQRSLDIYKSIDPSQTLFLDAPTLAEIEEAYSHTTEGVKRQLEAVKALGVVNGEVYEAQKNQFDAAQKLRGSELNDILRNKKAIEDFKGAIQGLKELSTTDALFDNPLTRKEVAKRIGVGIDATDIPEIEKTKIKNELKVASEKRIGFYEVLTRLEREYNVRLSQSTQEELTKRNEIQNSEIEFQSKKNEQLYQLNLKLQERITQAKSTALQEGIAYQSQYEDNLTQLVKANTSRREDELRKLNIEKDQERKAIGIVDEEKYLELKNGIIKEYAQKEDEIYDQNNTRRIEAEKRARDIILQIKASNLANTNGVNTAGGILNLDTILEQQDITAQQQRVALQNQRKQAIDDARKYHVDILQVEQQFDDAEKSLIEKQNREKLDLQIKYYSDLSNFVKSEGNRALLQFLADPTASGANAQKFLNGEQSGGDFRRKHARASFKDALAINKLNIANKQNELGQAQANQENIINNPEATVEDVKKIDEEVNRLTGDLQKLNENQATIITDEHIRQFNIGINLYNQLAQSAVQAYNTIAAARQEDLDREIAARTQRVDVALKLAERGNTEALNIEQEGLRKAQQERRQDALQQQAINSALTFSNSALAVAKSAAEGGIFAPATIIATVSALIAGFATVSTLSRASRTTGFEKGGFTGEGNPREEAGVVHKGEYVMPANITKKYRPLLEAIHKGEGIPMLRMPQHVNSNEQGVSKQQFERLEGAVYSVVDAINGKDINVSQVMNEKGLVQKIEQVQRGDRNKYRGG